MCGGLLDMHGYTYTVLTKSLHTKKIGACSLYLWFHIYSYRDFPIPTYLCLYLYFYQEFTHTRIYLETSTDHYSYQQSTHAENVGFAGHIYSSTYSRPRAYSYPRIFWFIYSAKQTPAKSLPKPENVGVCLTYLRLYLYSYQESTYCIPGMKGYDQYLWLCTNSY